MVKIEVNDELEKEIKKETKEDKRYPVNCGI